MTPLFVLSHTVHCTGRYIQNDRSRKGEPQCPTRGHPHRSTAESLGAESPEPESPASASTASTRPAAARAARRVAGRCSTRQRRCSWRRDSR
ncbi:protein of unknown function (plasmid) [Azospirillum baldaniorum]|uniref:Uncharacterized protein n=1 Tax=Azospirillum baldaniorum TaxID=1064539 RepID=A0A9P1NRL5_9PROT|nr:protein of unknown function [Azospirillum baldaniorum]